MPLPILLRNWIGDRQWLWDYVRRLREAIEDRLQEVETKLVDLAELVSDLTGAESALITLSRDNKRMPALATLADGDLACAIPIAATPMGFCWVVVNGTHYEPIGVGGPCYFSGDGGITPRSQGTIIQGDRLYWRGSVAEFQLDPNDFVSFDFLV